MMKNKYMILIWILAILLVGCLAWIFCLYHNNNAHSEQRAVIAQTYEDKTKFSEKTTSKDTTQKTTQNTNLTEQAPKNDIFLAAAKTQLMTFENMKTNLLENQVSYILPSTGKYVYLTFDDGPSKNTPAVLDILKKNNIKATFFVVYNKNADYYKQIVAGGHTLALHTYTHDYKQVYSSCDAYFNDLNKISSYVQGITGIKTNIIRLPGGGSNLVSRDICKGVMTTITQELQKRGYIYYDWNAQCKDAVTKGISAAQVLINVKSYTEINGIQKPYIILLLHNGNTETTTKDALQSIIDYYRTNGYQFEQITDDTPAIHQVVQN